MFQYFFTYDSEIPKGLEVKNFSSTHFVWLAVIFLALLFLIGLYRRLNKSSRKKMMRGIMLLIIALEILREGWVAIIGHYEISRHLPLHLCGIMIFVEAAAVFTNKVFFKEFSYAIGLPGAAMALITPEPSGYPFWNIQYLQSIVIHALLVLVPLLWIYGEGFRPNIRVLPKNLMLLVCLAAACFGINFLLGSNYMFVRFAPADTPIQLFDEWVGWPGYIGLMLAAVLIVWLAMYVPWEAAARRKRKTGHAVNE